MHLDSQGISNHEVGAKGNRHKTVDAIAKKPPIANANTDATNKPIPIADPEESKHGS